LTHLFRRTLPFVSERLFEKCAAKRPICIGVATDASEQIGFVQSVCPTDALNPPHLRNAVVLRVTDSFFAAIVVYVPALVFLTGAIVALYARSRTRELLYGVASLLLMFVAAAIQRSEVGIDLLDLDHNALYHVVQGVALALFFRAAWWCVDTEHGKESPCETTSIF
jgi:hypothetical protein